MDQLKHLLPSKIFEVIDKAGIATTKEVMLLSVWDIKKITNLRSADIILLKNVVADYISPQSITCDILLQQEAPKVSSGCPTIDTLLKGGFRRGTLTEIYGESGSGKTQITIQAAAHNWSTGSVFICTEDLFPVKRFEQMKKNLAGHSSAHDYGKNVFVEHITEANELLSCVRVRLPKLLQKNKLSIIVIDSVAAPFRSEYTNYMQRAEDLRELAMSLISLALEYNLAVLCINQVTASFNGQDEVLPSLGLAWSNMVSTRLWLRKTLETINLRSITPSDDEMTFADQNVNIRELSVIFAPDLPNLVTKIVITPAGVRSAEL